VVIGNESDEFWKMISIPPPNTHKRNIPGARDKSRLEPAAAAVAASTCRGGLGLRIG
jgi:hypothetical protein